MALEEDLSEPARLLLLVSLLAKDRLISHNGEAWGVQNRHKQKKWNPKYTLRQIAAAAVYQLVLYVGYLHDRCVWQRQG